LNFDVESFAGSLEKLMATLQGPDEMQAAHQ
jgi:hypothetical protein